MHGTAPMLVSNGVVSTWLVSAKLESLIVLEANPVPATADGREDKLLLSAINSS